jgi:putative hemolysin
MKGELKATLLATVYFLLLTGCTSNPTETIQAEENVGLPNPASVYCEEQGGTLEIRTEADGGQYGVCIFPDGSECDEWAYFRGECKPGDSLEVQPLADQPEPTAKLDDITRARQAIVAYLIEQYGIKVSVEWEEYEGGPEDSQTRLFKSGYWSMALTPAEDNIESPTYIVEIGDISGFIWQGTIAADGEIQETSYFPPATILTPEQARDAVVSLLVESYSLSAPGVWEEERLDSELPGGLRYRYTSGAWIVEVNFQAAAPIVGSYEVIIDHTDDGLHWEGEITARGEITEN